MTQRLTSENFPNCGTHKRMEENHQAPLLHYWGNTPEEEFYAQRGIKGNQSYFTSPTTGLSLFTRSWLPLAATATPPRALIFMVHGYGNDTGWTLQSTSIFLAQQGFACFGLDLPGHGRSGGLRAFVPNIDAVVDDCIEYFQSVGSSPEYHGVPRFLFGESMGGAICLLIHLKMKKLKEAEDLGLKGAVLIAPMCRISEKVKPRWPIPQILTFVGRFLPTLPIVPSADLLDKSVKVPEKKMIAAKNPMRYNGRPRLGTVIELLRVTEYLSQRLQEVSISFIVVHGSDDVVTDPNVSRALYEEATSRDKTVKIFPGMLHSLLFGETDENVERVRKELLCWLNDRCCIQE
ncbi:hypothetical protein V2J09_018903 [Rumex salicifolius]